MNYWKYIDLDPVLLKIIQEKSMAFLNNNTHHMDKTKFMGPFNNLGHDFINHVPEVREAFRQHNMFYEDANIFLMWNNKDCVPHKDYTDSIARVNIPLLNCDGTYIVFYENLKAKRLILPTSAPFYATVNNDYKEVARVEFNRPIIARISEGHHVIMDETRVPRITLTMSFNPDPGLLLDD